MSEDIERGERGERGTHAEHGGLRVEVVSDELAGEGGFLHLRRMKLRNVRPDGSRSETYRCDFVERKKGIDAVVLVLFRDGEAGVEVLLRDGLRPPLAFGRPPEKVPIPDDRDRLFFTEVVAGIIESDEFGEDAVRSRAAAEAFEEAGVRVDPKQVVMLGHSFPSPGLTAEKFHFTAARVTDAQAEPPEGDGSPMEEGAHVRWVPLAIALDLCRSGEIEDAKTEIILRRLVEHLAAGDGK